MKKALLLLILNFSTMKLFSQNPGEWMWLSGDSTAGSTGVYGTQGVPSVNNFPPGMYEYNEWKDKQGNFWIYSGDLWKYDPLTNEWTWVKGNGWINQSAVYGIKGVSNISNTPGSRTLCAPTWVDTSGNLWLFGGGGGTTDLWKYTISNNEWTWMHGDSLINGMGIHGTMGIPAISNVPGTRSETNSAWTDTLNNLWLFGGNGIDDAGMYGCLNDLMKYDISTNEWTWMNGSAFRNAPVSYGTKGVASPSNNPGGRYTYCKWKDVQGNFWLMGGYYPSEMNDVWKYSSGTNLWTWMAGSDQPDDAGNYQNPCSFDTINLPRGRYEHKSSVTDHCGRFWIFGGRSLALGGGLNDLWIFDPMQLKWSWIDGSNIPNQTGNFGAKGISSPLNMPPSSAGCLAWWGDNNRFYTMGGWKYPSFFNSALWVYRPDTNCISVCNALPSADFSSPEILCPGSCTGFNNLSSNAFSYRWFFPGATPDSSTATNPLNICYPNTGSYDVQLIASNALGSDTLLLPGYITVYPQPLPQSITQSGDTLFALQGATYYQWYFNHNIVNGATDYFFIAPASGDYNVVATDANGCEVEAAIFNVVATTALLSTEEWPELSPFPNPALDKLEVRCSRCGGEIVNISVYNVTGRQMSYQNDCSVRHGILTVDCRLLPAGIYYIEISTQEKTFRTRFIKR